MAINDPGTLDVECDKCGEVEVFDTTEYSGGEGQTFGVDSQTLEAAGWKRRSGEIICYDCCKAEDDEKEGE